MIIYVSLSPFSGWQSPGNNLFHFLFAPWPRYVTAFDLTANALAYMPLGILLFDLLGRRLGRVGAVAAAACGGFLLSLGLESLQAFLPMRFSSRVDLLANSTGALLGGIFAAALGRTSLVRGLVDWRHKTFNEGAHAEFGEVMLAAWIFMQLNPSIPFFAAGTITNPLMGEWNIHPDDPFYLLPQGLAVAFNVCGLGLFASVLVRPWVNAVRLVVGVIALGGLIKMLAAGMLLKPQLMLDWFGIETFAGIVGGLIVLWLAIRLSHRTRIYLAAMIILAGGFLAKMAGIYDPFSTTLKVFNWPHGQLLNFTSLTLLLNEVWPLAALVYLLIGFNRLPTSDARADV